ncbi:MAG: ABC transporter ATP-binding protein [Fibrobacterota bacterium]
MELSVKDISFSYKRNIPVLENISFTLRQHEILAVLGPNGVGKTTLLKCLNAIHRPAGGHISMDGTDILALSPREIAKRIAYVAQSSARAGITVYDAVLLGRYPYIKWNSTSKDHRVVEDIITRLHLSDFALRPLDELSGGELQKVATARALAQQPEILLLDEPTSNLDLKNQYEILTFIRQVVQHHDVGAVITMHDLSIALRYADSFLFVKEGEVFCHCRRGEVTEEMIRQTYDVDIQLREIDGHPVLLPKGEI